MRTIRVAKKTDCRLIRYARVWRSCWGDTITYEGSGPTMMGFFSLALHFSHLGLGFRSRPINILFCPSFCISLGLILILILFIFICFNFNASWSLFFSISVFSAFNLIFFFTICSSFFRLMFFHHLHLFYYYFNSFFFQILVLIFFITLFLSFFYLFCFKFSP